MNSFGDRLRKARVDAGLTQEQLGFSIDISKSSISAWENNREMPSFKILPSLSRALGHSLDYLVCNSSYGPPSQPNTMQSTPSHLYAKNTKEALLLANYRRLTKKRQQALISLIQD